MGDIWDSYSRVGGLLGYYRYFVGCYRGTDILVQYCQHPPLRAGQELTEAEDEGIKLARNISNCLPVDTAYSSIRLELSG